MANPVKNPKISQPWGRPNPRYAAKRHTGIDFACPVGTPIFAVANGVIEDVIVDRAYGKVVILRCSSAEKKIVHIWYCHLSRQDVKKGQRVEEGAQLGLTGNTGNSTGPHLHLETRVAPFRYGNDVSNPFLNIPGIIDAHAPSERKIGLWKKTVAAVKPASSSKPTKVVHMSGLVFGSTNDDIKVVQSALIDLCGADIIANGVYDDKTKEAYKLWQHKLGFHGKDADGIPGKKSMTALAKRYGFKLV